MSFCKICGGYVSPKAVSRLLGAHACPPEWEWRDPLNMDEEDWDTVHAPTAEDAALKAAREIDADESSLARCAGEPREVFIRSPLTKEISRWSIWAEIDVNYHCREKSEGED